MTGWAAGLTAAPCGALRICAGRPGRRSVDHGLVSDRARGTDRVHGGGARDDGTDLEAGIVRRVSGHTAAAAGAARSAGQGDRIRVGGEPEEPRNRWVRGGGGRDEPGHALRPWALCWRRMGARRWGETRGRGAVNGPRSARHPAAPAPRRWVGVARALRAAAEPDSPLVIAQRRGVGFAEKGSCPGSRAHGPAPSTARRPVVGATAEAAGERTDERTEEPVRRGWRQVARTVALVGVEVLGPGRGGRRDGGHAARRRT